MQKQGRLIVLEGIDGSGKSSLAQSLYAHFSQLHKTVLTKEPGATALGKKIRTIVQEQSLPLCAKAEYLLFAADRAQHMDELVAPALKEGFLVISDRMADSSLVYQGFARGLDPTIIKTVNDWAMNSIKPDIILFVQTSLETARTRLLTRNEKLTAFELQDQNFMQKVADGFEALYRERNDVILIDGEADKATIYHHALNALKERIESL